MNVNERKNVNERMKKGMKEGLNVNDWMTQNDNEWIKESMSMNGWMTECVWMNKWMNV